MQTLYLGSSSQSRQMLLRDADIPFTLVKQSADETMCDWGLSLQQVVESIALYKMEHIILPKGKDGEVCFILTADTLTENSAGKLEGKPTDREDAITKLKSSRKGVRTGTAFCLERRVWKNNAWHVDVHLLKFVQASYIFHVPDNAIDFYLDNVPVIGSGAIAIEGFGSQFLKTIDGSYTAVVGMPMYELRECLTQLGFFKAL
ncbi:MAG: Maf family protein [Candidatus Dependentiae bacterium]